VLERPPPAGEAVPKKARGVDRRRILFICGSLNQTTQMHQIARELPEHEHAFTPFYLDGPLEWARRSGLVEFTVAGDKLVRRCRDYLEGEGLPLDYRGERGSYDLVLSPSDLYIQRNAHQGRLVLVQEGILDPEDWTFRLWRRLPFLPRWIAGTATSGLSLAYDRFCVASEGYRDHFVQNGVPFERLAVTGIPNFDDCERYRQNDFPHRGYVLVCSSDARETFKSHDRPAFLRECLEIAAGRKLIFKLHPNENAERAAREIRGVAPEALVYARGSAEEMIANCEVLITQYSSTVFVGLALGKKCYSSWDVGELRRLMPIQNRSAARNIAQVCREVLADSLVTEQPARPAPRFALPEAEAP
jgi:hypothetical protein